MLPLAGGETASGGDACNGRHASWWQEGDRSRLVESAGDAYVATTARPKAGPTHHVVETEARGIVPGRGASSASWHAVAAHTFSFASRAESARRSSGSALVARLSSWYGSTLRSYSSRRPSGY